MPVHRQGCLPRQRHGYLQGDDGEGHRGEIPHVEKVTPENRLIANEFIYCKPGIFDRLAGFEELKTDGVISDYYLFKWQGAEFDTIENSGDRVAGFTVQADDLAELNRKHRAAVDAMRVLDVNGNDMMRRDLLTDISY